VCCSVLQRVAVCCSVLQCVAVCCSVLQCVEACCSVLQTVVRYAHESRHTHIYMSHVTHTCHTHESHTRVRAVHCMSTQCVTVAVCCTRNVLQLQCLAVAVRCSQGTCIRGTCSVNNVRVRVLMRHAHPTRKSFCVP